MSNHDVSKLALLDSELTIDEILVELQRQLDSCAKEVVPGASMGQAIDVAIATGIWNRIDDIKEWIEERLDLAKRKRYQASIDNRN